MRGEVLHGWVVPGRPHPLLAADQSPAWAALRDAFAEARARIAASGADLLVLYSTQWLSVIGHQVQADPEPEWVHVDEEWHALGSIPYKLRVDAEFAAAWVAAARERGLHTRPVAYRGFPIDTGTLVASKLLNPDNALPICVVSCNMYADRAETLVLGKATRDAVQATGRRAVAVAVTALSNRLFTTPIDPAADRISSLKDDEWNRKILEFLGEGRLEDVAQLARTFTREANADQKFKAIWWLAALLGQHNGYEGDVLAYQPIWGTGAALAQLRPSPGETAALEFDEDDVEVFHGDRNVLDTEPVDEEPSTPPPAEAPGAVDTGTAPRPVGPYPHARREGDLLFLSGMGPRQPGTDAIPGGPIRDETGAPRDYDVAAQTRACIENIARVLEASGASLQDVVDVGVFLVDMDRDFATFNEVYTEYFSAIRPTRTTVAVSALPTPIAVELKVVARVPR